MFGEVRLPMTRPHRRAGGNCLETEADLVGAWLVERWDGDRLKEEARIKTGCF